VPLGGRSMKTMRSLVKLKIGGLAGLIAGLIGKSPPDLRYRLVAGDVPAFVRFEGVMFFNGPVWRLEMTFEPRAALLSWEIHLPSPKLRHYL